VFITYLAPIHNYKIIFLSLRQRASMLSCYTYFLLVHVLDGCAYPGIVGGIVGIRQLF